MSESPQFEHLAATWSDHPTGTACAALAEGYRKRGLVDDARALAFACVQRWPAFLPGHLVLARVHRDQGDLGGAEAALRIALGVDPSHPVVFEDLAALAERTGHAGDARAWRQLRQAAVEPEPPGLPGFLAGPATPSGPGDEEDGEMPPLDDEPGEPGEEVLTESLAALYQAQGHLERAADVYQVLASRSPGNLALADRRNGLLEELARRRPRPYDARESGGVALGEWLRQMAQRAPGAGPGPGTGYDAFFQAPTTRDVPEDLEAFQSWLKGLGR